MGANSLGWSRMMRERLDLDEPLEAIVDEVVDAMVARFDADGAPLIDGAVTTVRRLAATYPLGVASSAHPAGHRGRAADVRAAPTPSAP